VQAKRVEEDSQRQLRQVDESEVDESLFKPVKKLVRENEEEEAAAAEAEAERQAARNASKKQRSGQVINLDEFRGGREADGKYRAPYLGGESRRGGFDGPRGGARGGRGGSSGIGFTTGCYNWSTDTHPALDSLPLLQLLCSPVVFVACLQSAAASMVTALSSAPPALRADVVVDAVEASRSEMESSNVRQICFRRPQWLSGRLTLWIVRTCFVSASGSRCSCRCWRCCCSFC
jgi:hypothetical protein